MSIFDSPMDEFEHRQFGEGIGLILLQLNLCSEECEKTKKIIGQKLRESILKLQDYRKDPKKSILSNTDIAMLESIFGATYEMIQGLEKIELAKQRYELNMHKFLEKNFADDE